MNDTPVFLVRDAQGFYDNLIAVRPDPVTGIAKLSVRHLETLYAELRQMPGPM